jgi:hypothetical protein
LFFLKRNATPSVLALTTASLRACIFATSILGSSTVMPCRVLLWRIWSKSSVLSSSALLGMHPTRTQVPPSALSFSTQAVLRPSCAARMAAT